MPRNQHQIDGENIQKSHTSPPHLKTSVSFVSLLTCPACLFEYTGLSCALVPGRSILLKSAVLRCVSFTRSSPLAPRDFASSTAWAMRFNCDLSRRMISSFSPFSRWTKGCVHTSPMGKLNFNFCLGVRSACRKTVTFALRIQVGGSPLLVASADGIGRSGEDDTRMQRLARISAALSVWQYLARKPIKTHRTFAYHSNPRFPSQSSIRSHR